MTVLFDPATGYGFNIPDGRNERVPTPGLTNLNIDVKAAQFHAARGESAPMAGAFPSPPAPEQLAPNMVTNGDEGMGSVFTQVTQTIAAPGDDLRDVAGDPFHGSLADLFGGGDGDEPSAPAPGDGNGGGGGAPVGTMSIAVALSRLPAILIPIVRPILRAAMSGGVLIWNRVPGWVRTALAAVGIVEGINIVDDLISGGGGFGGEEFGPGGPGVSVVGSWTANGVTFYRLSDGRLAVQNKKGRWKIWRPKKPIVLMPTGAGDLRTLLRADAVLNRQSKRIATMLNRRAPRPRRTKSTETIHITPAAGHITSLNP